MLCLPPSNPRWDMGDLLSLPTKPRDDLHKHPAFQKHRPPSVGHEASLQQFIGTNVFHWYHRTTISPLWVPYGEPMVIDGCGADHD